MPDTPLKQRIIGAVVLISLAVIFLPIWLTQEEDPLREGAFIPEPTDRLKTIIFRLNDEGVFEPQIPDGGIPETPQSEAEAAEPTPQNGVATREAEAKPRPEARRLDNGSRAQGGDRPVQAWMVQLGSFGREANALGLRDKLREQGYPGFVDRRDSDGKSIWRVRVGPYAKQAEAQSTLKTLEKQLKLKGLVLRHR